MIKMNFGKESETKFWAFVVVMLKAEHLGVALKFCYRI